MSTDQEVKIDERTVAVMSAGNTWALNFLIFALLLDIMYRSVVFDENAWDLFALLGVSGAISMTYQARHKVLGQVFGRRVVIALAVVAFVVAAIAAVLAATQAR